MSESQNEPAPVGPAPLNQASIDRRAWPAARQWRVTVLGVVAVAVHVLAIWLGNRALGSHEQPQGPPPSPRGTFRPTAQQLKTLTIAPVGNHAFVSEEMTEGKDRSQCRPLHPGLLPLLRAGDAGELPGSETR